MPVSHAGLCYGIVARVLGAVCAVCPFVCLSFHKPTRAPSRAACSTGTGRRCGATASVVDRGRGVTRTLTTDGAGQYIANA